MPGRNRNGTPKPPKAPKPPPPARLMASRIPDFTEQDTTAYDDPCRIVSVKSKRQKSQQITRDVEFALDITAVDPGGWPDELDADRARVDRAVDGGPVVSSVIHPKLPVVVTVVSIVGDTQSRTIGEHPAVLRRIKVTAKEDLAEVRWLVRFEGTDGMAQAFEDATAGRVQLSMLPKQGSLLASKPRPSATELPPEPGDGPAH